MSNSGLHQLVEKLSDLVEHVVPLLGERGFHRLRGLREPEAVQT